jgi:fermentation-respiration switch protein FrsA (DUF1100 family)
VHLHGGPQRLVTSLLSSIVLLVGLALLFEEKLIYFPSERFDVTPEMLSLDYEDVTLLTSDEVRIHAWFLPSPDPAPDRFTLLVCHGNAGNIADRLDRTLLFHRNLRADVLLFDYRGYGGSEGSPDEGGTYRDARAAYDYLVDRAGVSPERLILFGESLGAAVAVELAREIPAAGLVLEAPFTSIPDMARVVYPFVPTGWIRTRYDNLRKIPELSLPIFIIHGTEDDTVPFEQGKRLYGAAPEPKRFLAVEGAGHSDSLFVGGDRYWVAWRGFLKSIGETERD